MQKDKNCFIYKPPLSYRCEKYWKHSSTWYIQKLQCCVDGLTWSLTWSHWKPPTETNPGISAQQKHNHVHWFHAEFPIYTHFDSSLIACKGKQQAGYFPEIFLELDFLPKAKFRFPQKSLGGRIITHHWHLEAGLLCWKDAGRSTLSNMLLPAVVSSPVNSSCQHCSDLTEQPPQLLSTWLTASPTHLSIQISYAFSPFRNSFKSNLSFDPHTWQHDWNLS